MKEKSMKRQRVSKIWTSTRFL